MPALKQLIDRGQFLREVTSFPIGVTNDGVIGFTIDGKNYVRVKKGSTFQSEEIGIWANGSDMTARLQSRLDHASVKQIVFDAEGGAITINGTVNVPSGKKLTFKNGTSLTGTGTINGGLIKVESEGKAFDTTINFTNVVFVGKYINVKWFGAVGNNSNDDQPAIQKAVDVSIGNPNSPRDVYFPMGAYKIDSPIIVAYKNTATSYGYFTCNLVGQMGGSFTSSTFSVRILPSFSDTFAIGYQTARASVIKGLSIEGKFNPVFAGGLAEQFATKYEDFVSKSSVVCRDNANSPYAAIVIDPFTNNGTTLNANNYPGLDSWYTYATSGAATAGSSGIRVEDCRIRGFVVGHVIAPNGVTRNGENMSVERISVDYCKIAFLATNDQQKGNTYKNIICWGNTHTVFQNMLYGAGTPGQFHVDTVNIAGGVNRMFNIATGGYYGSFFTDIYAESLFKLGVITGSYSTVVQNSHFQFEVPESSATMPSQDTYGFLKAATFNDCVFRKYDGDDTDFIFFNVGYNVNFKDCIGEQLFFLDTDFGSTPQYQAVFTNTKTSNGLLVGSTGAKGIGIPFGNSEITDIGGSSAKFTYKQTTNPFVYLPIGTVAVTKSGTSLSLTASQNASLLTVGTQLMIYAANSVGVTHFDTLTTAAQPNQLMYGWAPLGLIKTVNTGTGAITIDNAPVNLVSGTYTIYAIYPLKVGTPFIADVTNASPNATNVECLNNNFPAVGDIIQGNFTGGFARVSAVNSTSKTITFDRNFLGVAVVGQEFINGSPEIVYNLTGTSLASNVLYFKRAKIRQIVTTTTPTLSTAEVVTSGFYNAAGTGKIHEVAIFAEKYDPVTQKISYYTNGNLSTSVNIATEDYVYASTISTHVLGITTSGDQTSALNTALANSNYKTYIVDVKGGGDITVNGTVTVPTGKVLKFVDGTKLTGTGTLTGGTIDCGIQQIFSSSINVTNVKFKNNILYPQYFGAVGDGIIDDSVSFQKMFDLLATQTNNYHDVIIPRGVYLCNTTVNLPNTLLTGSYQIKIWGYGAKIKTTSNITIWKRIPVDQTLASTLVSNWIGSIKGIQFEGNSIYGATQNSQIALNLGALYSWNIEDCVFLNFHIPIQIEFGLSCKFKNLRFNFTGSGFVGRWGTWTGATNSNSAFNANIFEGCRWYSANGSFTAVHLIAADQNSFYDCISEGLNPQYNFYIDYDLSTNINYTHFENTWIESTGGVNTSNTIFYIRQLGTFYCKNLQRIYPNKIFERPVIGTGSSGKIIFDGIPYDGNMPSGVWFDAGGNLQSGNTFEFINLAYGSVIGNSLTDVNKWQGGIVPYCIKWDYAKSANGGYLIGSNLPISIEAGKGLTPLNQYLLMDNGILQAQDNVHSWGTRGTANNRPKGLMVGTDGLSIDKVGKIYFKKAGETETVALSQFVDNVLRIEAIGGVDLPSGTTVQRPTGLARRFRYNTDLNTIEWYNGTAWVQPITTAANGSETKVTAGANVTVTGTGTTADPYVINSSGGSGSSPVIRTVTANANFLTSDYTLLVDTSAGNVTITIDNLSSGQLANIKKITNDVNTVTVVPTSGTIDGGANYILDAYNESIMMQRDATNYYILNK